MEEVKRYIDRRLKSLGNSDTDFAIGCRNELSFIKLFIELQEKMVI